MKNKNPKPKSKKKTNNANVKVKLTGKCLSCGTKSILTNDQMAKVATHGVAISDCCFYAIEIVDTKGGIVVE
jgi:hypothetical protein